MTDSLAEDHNARTEPSRGGRLFARLLVLIVLTFIFVEAAPGRLSITRWARPKLSPVLTRLGLWQGEWTLFAPNPGINNAWLSAEIYPPHGDVRMWNSTYFAEASGWELFLHFRHINYNNRLHATDRAAADDFADYLARRLISPTARPIEALPTDAQESSALENDAWELSLFRSQLNLTMPDDGSLPTREETLWISTSENLTVRRYAP